MTMATVDIVSDDTERLVLAVSGEIDMANAAAMQQELLSAISNQPTSVSVDLSGLTFLDSAGLRILFTLADRLHVLQIEFELVVPVDSVPRRAIELAGFPSLMTLRTPTEPPRAVTVTEE